MVSHNKIHRAIHAKMQTKDRRLLPISSGKRYSRYTLAELLGELRYNVGAEVGVRFGNFSLRLFKSIPMLKLYCIDPWDEYSNKYRKAKQERIYQQAKENLKNYNAIIIRKSSLEAVKDFKDGSLDFVFIDGNHKFDFIVQDLIYWPPKVKPGGIIMVHDFYPFDDCGVWNAVPAYMHSHRINPWYVTKEYEPTVYWVKK